MLTWRKDDLLTLDEKAAAAAREETIAQMPETVSNLQTAQEDTDALLVDQEYRLTLLELGLTEEDL